METTSYKVPAAIVLGGALVALALFLSMGGDISSLLGRQGHPALVRPVASTDHIFGDPTARAIIVEYADLDSPYCSDFSNTLHQIVATEGADGSVAWVYRAFPLSLDEGNALALARAAECAGMAGGEETFWRFIDLLYASQPVDPGQLGTLAKKAAVPTDAFATCYADAASRVDARIKADRANALAVGATGAPYSVLIVRGRAPILLDGAYPYDALKQVLDQALGN